MGDAILRIRKECSYLILFQFREFLCQLPRCFASPTLVSFLSPLETISQILDHSGFADDIRQGKFCWAMDLGLELRHRALRLQWIEHFGLFSHGWAPCLEIRNPNSSFLSPLLLHFCRLYLQTFFAGLFFNLSMCESALCPNVHPVSVLYTKHSGECHVSRGGPIEVPRKCSLHAWRDFLPHRLFPKASWISLNTSHFVIASFILEKVDCIVAFSRLLL